MVSYIKGLLPKSVIKIPKSTTSGDTNSPSAIKQPPFVMWNLKGHKHFDNHMLMFHVLREIYSVFSSCIHEISTYLEHVKEMQ